LAVLKFASCRPVCRVHNGHNGVLGRYQGGQIESAGLIPKWDLFSGYLIYWKCPPCTMHKLCSVWRAVHQCMVMSHLATLVWYTFCFWGEHYDITTTTTVLILWPNSDTLLSQVLGTVRHGVGHKDAAGVLTSAGAPLWFIRGCSPQHNSFGGRDCEVKTARSRPGQERNVRAYKYGKMRSAKGHENFWTSELW
jgi:hypothetical protein